VLKADMIQGTRLLAQEHLLEAPEPARVMQSGGLPIGEMTSQERFEFFRPRILPPEPSDETPEDVSTDAGSAGTGEDYSRADHVHYANIPAAVTATPSTIASGGGAVGTSAKYAKEDHAHPYTPPTAAPDPYTELPEAVVDPGSESPGTSSDYSRGDHKHPLPFSDPLYMSGSPGNLTVNIGDGLTTGGGGNWLPRLATG